MCYDWSSLRRKLSPKIMWQTIKKFAKNWIKMHFRTDARSHQSSKYLWIKALRTLEIDQITNAF